MTQVRQPIAPQQRCAFLPNKRLFTVDEYHRVAEAGVFGPDERLELIHGEVIEHMAPQKTPHANAIMRIMRALRGCVSDAGRIRSQLPVALDRGSEPEPDVAVVSGTEDDYILAHPRAEDIQLIVEISDSTLPLDHIKASVYAEFSVPEYWIVDVRNRAIAAHREPKAGVYASIVRFSENEAVRPLFAAEHGLAVVSLLPPVVKSQQS